MKRRHQPRSCLRQFRPGEPTAGQTYSRKVPWSLHRPSLITPPRLNVPAHSDPVQILSVGTFANLTRSAFCLLTGKSVERLSPPDTLNTEMAYLEFCESMISAAKQSIQHGHRKSYVPCWDKECETSIPPSSEPQWD